MISIRFWVCINSVQSISSHSKFPSEFLVLKSYGIKNIAVSIYGEADLFINIFVNIYNIKLRVEGAK